MSLARTALRLAAVEAVKPSSLATSADFPTIARHRVFDSRLDMIDDIAVEERAPIVVVYTENDTATSAQTAGGLPFKRMVDLVFEISIVAFAEHEAQPGSYEPTIPVSDGETEASLDLLEAGIRFALFKGPTGVLFRKITGNGKVPQIESTPQRASEEQVRIAMRTIIMRCEIPDDCIDLTPSVLASGLDALPEPLRTVIAALPAGSYGALIGAGLSPLAPRAPLRTPLSGVAINMDVANPDGEVDEATDVAVVATIPQD